MGCQMSLTRGRWWIAAAFAAISTYAADQAKVDQARDRAYHWLQLVDEGKYPESWDEAAQLFRNAVPKEKWVTSIQAVRGPLGKLLSRELAQAQYATEVPGAPDGEYVVLQFKTRFEHKKNAFETVTMALEPDGQWRASGYFIR